MGVEIQYWEFEKSLQNTSVKVIFCVSKLWSISYISKYNISIILKVKLGKAIVRGQSQAFWNPKSELVSI